MLVVRVISIDSQLATCREFSCVPPSGGRKGCLYKRRDTNVNIVSPALPRTFDCNIHRPWTLVYTNPLRHPCVDQYLLGAHIIYSDHPTNRTVILELAAEFEAEIFDLGL